MSSEWLPPALRSDEPARSLAELISDGDHDALHGFRDAHEAAVRAYCATVCAPEIVDQAVDASFGDLFGRLRAVGAANADLEALLLKAARSAAAGRFAVEVPDSAPADQTDICPFVPELLAARANGELDDGETELSRHVRTCAVCGGSEARMRAAERAYAAAVPGGMEILDEPAPLLDEAGGTEGLVEGVKRVGAVEASGPAEAEAVEASGPAEAEAVEASGPAEAEAVEASGPAEAEAVEASGPAEPAAAVEPAPGPAAAEAVEPPGPAAAEGVEAPEAEPPAAVEPPEAEPPAATEPEPEPPAATEPPALPEPPAAVEAPPPLAPPPPPEQHLPPAPPEPPPTVVRRSGGLVGGVKRALGGLTDRSRR